MADRKSIDLEDLPMHNQPFATCVRVGNMVFSSALTGMERGVGKVPDDAEAQIKNCFANMKALVEEAGGSVENIASVEVFLPDRDLRPKVNPHWEAMFPDPKSRPVRHTHGNPLPANFKIQMKFIAVV